MQGLEKNPHIDYVEEDSPRYLLAHMPSSHSLRGYYDYEMMVAKEDGIQEYKHRKLSESTPYGYDMVKAGKVTDLGKKKICIIDSGYSGTHPDLPHGTSGTPAVHGLVGLDHYGNGRENWKIDLCSHGTHVAGTIAALKNNGEGVVGVTNMTSLYIVKVFGEDNAVGDCSWSYSSTLTDAVVKCQTHGRADVINMSLGGGRATNSEETAMIEAYQNNVLLVAAAGNDVSILLFLLVSFSSI